MRVNADTMLSKKNWEKPKREQKENDMKKWYAIVKIEWSNFNIEAKTKKEAIYFLKTTFYDQYGIELEDSEIVELKEDKGE